MERWKPVTGFEDCYAVSDQGNVARTATYGSDPQKRWKLCAPRFKRGYTVFHLSKNGRTFDMSAHRMVWQAFNGPIPKHVEIDHKNDKRSDNRLSNLALVTKSQNTAYAFRRNGRPPVNNPSPGSKNGSAKLTEADIPDILRRYSCGETTRQIGDRYGVSYQNINHIVSGKTWRHVERLQDVVAEPNET